MHVAVQWPPLVERELRVALRKERPIRRRLITAACCSGGTLLFLLGDGGRSTGRQLHQILYLAGLLMVLRTPRMLASVFAAERRNQTLELLFLSDLTMWEVFASKLLSTALVAFTELLALFPLLALPFLTGGVSSDLFLATVVALPIALVFVASVCLLGSVLTEDEGMALVLAAVVAGLICAAGPAWHLIQLDIAWGFTPGTFPLRLSPAYGLYLVWNTTGSFPLTAFYQSLATTLGWSLICFAWTALALRRAWRGFEDRRLRRGWGKHWEQLMHGSREWRQSLAQRWLDVNPATWLAARDRGGMIVAWGIVGAIVAAWLSGWALWPRSWLRVPNVFACATLLNAALRCIMHYTAAKGMGQGRRDGSYELLLTTPLRPQELVRGQVEALRLQFRAVGRFVLALNVLLMGVGLAVRAWTDEELVLYLGAWALLLWWAWRQASHFGSALVVMWAGLNSARPAYAVWRSSGLNSWFLLWIAFNLHQLLSKPPAFSRGSPGELTLLLGVAAFFSCLWLPVGALVFCFFGKLRWRKKPDRWEDRLVSEFREIVRKPLPDRDDLRSELTGGDLSG